jgi:hypothetical protein
MPEKPNARVPRLLQLFPTSSAGAEMSTSPFVGSATNAGPLGRQVEGARLEEPGGLAAAGGAGVGGDETEDGTGAAFLVLETGVVRCECLSLCCSNLIGDS